MLIILAIRYLFIRKNWKDHIERFIQSNYKQPDLYLRDETPEFLDKFETYFRVTWRLWSITAPQNTWVRFE